MKTRSTFLLLSILTLPLISLFARQTREYEIPAGWKFQSILEMKNGHDIMLVWQNIPSGQQLHSAVLSRLLIGDGSGNIINDISFDKPRYLSATRNGKIILTEGGERTDVLEVLDSNGKSLFRKPTYGKSPIPALLGNEIGLAEREPGFGSIPDAISIIDETSGQERFTMSSSGRDFSGFLPIGENGQFLISIGATVFLKSYHEPNKVLWSIQDIGGNIVGIEPVNDNYISVQYLTYGNNPEDFQAGVSIIDWRSGEILFKQESHNVLSGEWKFLHNPGIRPFIDGKNLCFTGSQGQVFVVPFDASRDKGWDIHRLMKFRVIPDVNGPEISADRKFVFTKHDNRIRLEKLTLQPQ